MEMTAVPGSALFRNERKAVVEKSWRTRAAGEMRESVGRREAGAKTSPPCATAEESATIQPSPSAAPVAANSEAWVRNGGSASMRRLPETAPSRQSR